MLYMINLTAYTFAMFLKLCGKASSIRLVYLSTEDVAHNSHQLCLLGSLQKKCDYF